MSEIVEETPHVKIHAPPPRTRAPRPKKRTETLVDVEQPLFELTLSKFSPNEPYTDPKRKALQHVRVWEHHGEKTDNALPNMFHLVRQLDDCEQYKTHQMDLHTAYDQELQASNRRLALVKRGVPLFKLLNEEKPRHCSPVNPRRRFAAVGEILNSEPSKFSGIPPTRKIQFVHPYTARPPDRVDMVSRIKFAENQKVKLKRIIQKSDKQELQYHNEMIEYLNHYNDRRIRAHQQFFDDIDRVGMDRARLNAKRSAQRSRLRIMCDIDWWSEFLDLAFSQPLTREEERFIEKMSRHPKINNSEYVAILSELQERQNPNDRCMEFLEFISSKCDLMEGSTLNILMGDTSTQKKKFNRRK